MPKNLDIRLTAVENTLRTLLLDVADFIKSNPVDSTQDGQASGHVPPNGTDMVLRFTGGWVRDKLLGVDSHDIDVGINNMTGYQFGLRMKQYLEQPGISIKYGLEGVAESGVDAEKAMNGTKSKLVGGLHKIEANPEKSKHLETVTTRVLGLDIDLVNLRKETYTEDSRNPQMEFGTPEEDALRRDATINAMFYNLNTQELEDFTKQGCKDMDAHLIRTPLEPHQTFKDDPLRILRLIRFASRLNYQIEAEAKKSMQDEEIKAALRLKISRERVGVELEKMLRGPRPAYALSLIDEAGLYDTIFCDTSTNGSAGDAEHEDWKDSITTAEELLNSSSPLSNLLIGDDEDRYNAWVLACLIPYRNSPQPSAEPGKKTLPPVATNVAREGFKAPNKICDIVTAAVRHASDIPSLASTYSVNRKRSSDVINENEEREILGMAIRRWGVSWKSQTFYTLLAAIADDPSQKTSLITTYTTFLNRINALKLAEAYAVKPIIDGKQLAKAMNIKPGPWMKEALETVIAWQLRNPDSRDVNQAIEMVKNSKTHGELKNDIIRDLLRLTIRPLFEKNKHKSVTLEGRRDTTNSVPAPFSMTFDKDQDLWRNTEAQAFEILLYILQHIEDTTVEKNWHLLIPPILTILDDHIVTNKTIGCKLLHLLLQKTSPEFLTKTGLFPVFKSALMPCLGFLPSFTPEKESAALLEEAFSALLLLRSFSTETNTISSPDKVISLDELLRKGIFFILGHASDYASVSIVAVKYLDQIMTKLGLETIRHLQSILAILNDILSNPFVIASLPLVSVSINALQTLIRNSWPRIAFSRVEVLRALCVCWCTSIDSDQAEEFKDIQKAMQETVAMLREAVNDDHQFSKECTALIAADGKLTGLFEPFQVSSVV